MANGNSFDPRQASSEALTNRSQMSSEKTLQQIREDGENELQNLKLNDLNKYVLKSKSLLKELNKMALDDAHSLNYERTQLEKKYTDMVRRGKLSLKQLEIKIAKDLSKIAYQLNSQRIVEEKRQELELSRSKLAIKRKEIEDIKALEKSSRQEEYSARLKQLEDLKKQRRILVAAGKDTKSIDKKIYTAEKKVDAQKDKIAKENQPTARLGIKGELKDVGKQLKEGITGTVTELGSFLGGKTSKDELKERAEAGDKQAEATLKNIDILNDKMNNFVNGMKEAFDGIIKQYSSYQSKVNARLQGSNSSWNGGAAGLGIGISEKLMIAVGSNPYVKLADLMENASKAVEAGIAYNIEQRAFLETVKDDIATTFDAFNSNLLRIVRLQQSDSTAARLGLEADLTQLFNSYFKDTSYLNDAFDTVSANLTEAIAQMGTEEGVAFEYQVQKWLGSLYSVGFSDSAIGNIATALGQLGSGDVTGLASNSQMQNLIVMAASRVGLSYADMLTEGIDADTTNALLESMVEYLQEIATSDNKVVKSQYSQIFGLTSADLVAAKNLGTTALDIANESLSYAGAVNELYNQMNQLPGRLSIGEMTGNMIDNVKYAIGSGIADNPVTYALWELTDMVESLSGGLQLPTISVMGNMFDLNTSLTNLARLGIVGAGALGNVGTIVSGVGSTLSPSSMLTKLGISKQAETVTRGSGLNRSQRVTNQVSSSNMIGNSAGEDYEASLTAQANAEGEAAVETKKEEEQTKSINDIHEYLLQVFDPKVTAITRMIGQMSGTKLTDPTNWNIFEDQNTKQYTATTVSIVSLGEANNTSQLITSIKDSVVGIYEIMKKPLSVNVLSYPALTHIEQDSVETGGDSGGAGM